MILMQSDAKETQQVDLSSMFFSGPAPLPSFGVSSELIMPWNAELTQQLIL